MADKYVRAYAEYYDMTIKDAKAECGRQKEFFIEWVFERGKNLCLYNLGNFVHKKFKPKRSRIPGSDDYVVSPPKEVVKFTQSLKTVKILEE